MLVALLEEKTVWITQKVRLYARLQEPCKKLFSILECKRVALLSPDLVVNVVPFVQHLLDVVLQQHIIYKKNKTIKIKKFGQKTKNYAKNGVKQTRVAIRYNNFFQQQHISTKILYTVWLLFNQTKNKHFVQMQTEKLLTFYKDIFYCTVYVTCMNN
jgi:hypothetical protein